MGMKVLGDAFVNFQLKPGQLNTWFERLKDLDDIFFVGRVKKFIETSRFPPTIADLREGFESPQLTAFQAWEIARRYAREGRIPDDADPKIRRTIEYLGWYRMQYTEYNQLGFLEREFHRAYEGFTEEEKYEELALPAEVSREKKELMNDLKKVFDPRTYIKTYGNRENKNIKKHQNVLSSKRN